MSTETRLKPCPFCGGAAKEFERFNANVITCRRCGVKVRQSEMGEGDAAVRWNQRATPVAAQAQQPVSGADGLPQGWRMVPEKIPMKGLDDAIAWMRPAMNQAGRDLAYCLTGAWSILLDSVTPPDHLPDATKMVEPSGNSGELHASFESWRKSELPWTSPATPGIGFAWDAWRARAALAQQDATLHAEVLDMVRMIEANEWADHCGKSEIGQRLEWAITALQNRIAELTKSSSQQDADKVKADLLSSLVEIVDAVIASDEEGLIEHSETIIKARAAIDAARKEQA